MSKCAIGNTCKEKWFGSFEKECRFRYTQREREREQKEERKASGCHKLQAKQINSCSAACRVLVQVHLHCKRSCVHIFEIDDEQAYFV